MTSKVRAKCLEAVRNQPGILRSELCKMGIGHKSTVQLYESRLTYDGAIVRVWDKGMNSYRLYSRGTEPIICLPRFFKKNIVSARSLYFKESADHDFGKAHGDQFYAAFDEAFGLLYIDLKMIAGACGMMDGSNPPETRTKAVSSANISLPRTPMHDTQAGHIACADSNYSVAQDSPDPLRGAPPVLLSSQLFHSHCSRASFNMTRLLRHEVLPEKSGRPDPHTKSG